MLCPRCSLGLELGEVAGLAGHVCAQCGGVALSFEGIEGEAPKVLRALEKRLSKGDAPRPNRCPSCLARVSAVPFAEGMSLDACAKCQLVWLDQGELQALAGLG